MWGQKQSCPNTTVLVTRVDTLPQETEETGDRGPGGCLGPQGVLRPTAKLYGFLTMSG